MSTVTVDQPFDVGGLWRSIRVPVVIVVAAVALVALLAAVSRADSTPLDPRSTTSTGTHALAVLLGQRGVVVDVPGSVGSLTAGANAGDTVVLAQPGDLADRVLSSLASSSATVVLVDPQSRELRAFAVPATLDNEVGHSVLDPGCSLPAAQVAGSIDYAGDLYEVRAGTTGCYRSGTDAGLVAATRAGGGRTLVIGGGGPLTNAELAHQGDAALALGLLGGSTHLDWVPPGSLGGAVAPSDRRGVFSLLPRGLDWGLVQLAIAVVVLALWRARRLGTVQQCSHVRGVLTPAGHRPRGRDGRGQRPAAACGERPGNRRRLVADRGGSADRHHPAAGPRPRSRHPGRRGGRAHR
jgi:hypothetical protein